MCWSIEGTHTYTGYYEWDGCSLWMNEFWQLEWVRFSPFCVRIFEYCIFDEMFTLILPKEAIFLSFCWFSKYQHKISERSLYFTSIAVDSSKQNKANTVSYSPATKSTKRYLSLSTQKFIQEHTMARVRILLFMLTMSAGLLSMY